MISACPSDRRILVTTTMRSRDQSFRPLLVRGRRLSAAARALAAGAPDILTITLEFAAMHDIEAVVDVMPLARANEAIEKIRRRDVAIGLVLESQLRNRAHATPGIPSAKPARLAKPVKEGPMHRREPRYPLTSRPRTR